MNAFGSFFRVQIFGESHGDFVGCVIDGIIPGITLNKEDFYSAIERRKPGGAGTTPRQESDSPQIISGLFENKTTGAPLTIVFKNENVNSKDYTQFKEHFRPGHADFVASKKFKGFSDYRGGGHFSGRLTLPLVAAGVVAQRMLTTILPELTCNAQVIAVGGNADVSQAIEQAVQKNDSVGALVECRVNGLPVGLGEPFFDSCESLIAHAVFSIPAIKGIQFGSGFKAAEMYGSEHNDSITNASGKTMTNYSGGINGGVTNGNELVFSVSVKPASSTPQTQHSFHAGTGKKETLEVKGRHDLVIAQRVPPVLEAVTCIVLNDLVCRAKSNNTFNLV
jgi:chorismate synthase